MICDREQIAFPVGSLVEYKHASILEIGIWPQSNWGEKFGNRTFQVVDAKQVFVGYPVLDLVTEYLVVEHPSNATAKRLRFLEPQLQLVRSHQMDCDRTEPNLQHVANLGTIALSKTPNHYGDSNQETQSP